MPTVSAPVPSAMPTWPTRAERPEPAGKDAMFTPICWAMLLMFFVPTRCARSVNAVLEEMANAFCTGCGPWPMWSSLLNLNDIGAAFALSEVDKTIGMESGGTYSGLSVFRILVFAFIPSMTAWASTYGLNDDPTCSRAHTSVFTWQTQ